MYGLLWIGDEANTRGRHELDLRLRYFDRALPYHAALEVFSVRKD